ncbi:MAG: chemotaxis protein CheV [SAR324 cluster bacterium]|nr:chemotaxis protein CheV [SAR324 cluster bacterium]
MEQEILLETGTNEFEILEFFITEKSPSGKMIPNYFGMNVAKVTEVIESPNLQSSDYAVHPCFLGTIPLRGDVLPVLDLSVWLGMDRNKHEHENIIVTKFSNSMQGFLVSGVVEIHRLTWKELIPPGTFMQLMNNKSIIGMIDAGDHFIQLLDLEYIVTALNPNHAESDWHTTVKASNEYKALVVEDSPTIRKMLQKNLSASNFNIKMASNGEEAFGMLKQFLAQAELDDKTIKDFVDVVISDIEMPLMDGFTLTKQIKNNAGMRDLPVILYSSIITDELRHKGESVKADFQVSKPDMDIMAEKAIELIERT